MANKYVLNKSESMGGKAFLDGYLLCECPFDKESESVWLQKRREILVWSKKCRMNHTKDT